MVDKELMSKVMSELGKESYKKRLKKYGNFGKYMAKIKAKNKKEKVIHTNGLTGKK